MLKSLIRPISVLGALALASPAGASFWLDFNSNQAGGGTPVVGDPADATNAIHQEIDFLCYHARHENAGDFITASYDVMFDGTPATVTVTPEWPNSTNATVQQSIGRTAGQSDTWLGENVNLLRDWIGADSRGAQGGNGTWDLTTGTPTYMTLALGGLPAGTYDMTTFHHDVENMNSGFQIEVSTDGGATYGVPVNGRITNSLSGGNPAENEVLAGTPPNEAGGIPEDLDSTQTFSFAATGGSEVVLRFSPYDEGLRDNVHITFFALNGFKLERGIDPGDEDGDDLPDAFEDRYFGNNDGTATPAELALQDGGGDPDGDTIDNETEFFDSTDPTLADTDGDDLDDNDEKIAGTDPNDPDSDNDTLTDGAEVNDIGTSPLLADTDGDFFFDATEVALSSGTDPNVYPVSAIGMQLDFSSATGGTFHDQTRLAYVAEHEVDFSVDTTMSYPVPSFGAGVTVDLTVDFPDTVLNTVKQLIDRGNPANYTGNDPDLARDWIGLDSREASGGNPAPDLSSINLTFEGLPAGAYLLTSFHHDTGDQNGVFDVLLTDAVNTTPSFVGSRRVTANNAGDNPAAGMGLGSLMSTFNAVLNSDGTTPVVVTYQIAGGAAGGESFVVINGFDLIPTDDQDGDGMPDDYEDANGLDKTVNDADLDLDSDDLTNFEEYQLGTPPNNDDADDDGANDGAEVAAGSDPFVKDTDGDGLEDGPELDLGTDPTSVDSDGDGYGDADDPDPVDAGVPTAAETLCAYWPLDGTDGSTTPDLGPNGYDMTLTDMTADNFVVDEGRVAAMFDGSTTMLSYIASPGDALPITLNNAYTVSLWVKIAGTGQNDRRFFSEGSTTTNTPLFNMGTRNNGADDSFDLYVRPAGGPAHEFSNGLPLDGTWRHLAITGNGTTGQHMFYVDGVLDRDNFTFRDMTGTALDTTSIGGILRAAPSHWVTGLVDDVGLWKKALSPDDIAKLASGITPGELSGGARFAIQSIVSGPEGVTLTWNSKPGKSYAVRYSDDLDADTVASDPRMWPDLDDGVFSEGETTSFTDTSAPAGSRFYIIEEF